MTTKKRKATTHPRTANALFKELRRFFRTGPREVDWIERRRVWDALSGLRGPDDQKSSVKDATTAVIRERLLGNDAHDIGIHVGADNMVRREARVDPGFHGKMQPHFRGHAINAFAALGLLWECSNPPTKR